jgi:hypothetical protein
VQICFHEHGRDGARCLSARHDVEQQTLDELLLVAGADANGCCSATGARGLSLDIPARPQVLQAGAPIWWPGGHELGTADQG